MKQESILTRKTKVRIGETMIEAVIRLFTMATILITGMIIFTLLFEGSTFFTHVNLRQFLFDDTWLPLFSPGRYGIWPLVVGTLSIAFYSMLIAIPLGLGSAVYLSEYAPSGLRAVLKPILEVLAGIPSIVYGFFALNYITPALQTIVPSTEIFNILSAAIAVGMMILPTVASLSEDALSAVPKAMRNGAYALGATRFEVTRSIVIPAAKSGIISSFILAVSRAVGETMIVAIAAGSKPMMTFNPVKSIQTMTGYMMATSTGEIGVGTIQYQSIYAVGIVLFAMTLILNLIARRRRG